MISYSPEALKVLSETTGFRVVSLKLRSGAFNFVRSLKYFIDKKGESCPRWFTRVDWVHSKGIRRALKPFFFLVDVLGWGDVMHSELMKTDAAKR